MKLNIQYSVDFEVERVLATLYRLEWYKTNGYKPVLPESFDVSDIHKITEEITRIAVVEEYNEQHYLEAKKYIEERWPSTAEGFIKGVKITDLILLDEYEIYLTRYGVGGSYDLPNKIIINIAKFYEFGLSMAIAHETIHISIQKFIDQYKIEHWVKERVVDLLLEQISPKLNEFQFIPIETQKIDETFKQHYPNVELILKSLGTSE